MASDGYFRELPFIYIEQVPKCTSTVVVVSVFLSISWLTVVLRFWTRIRIVRNLGWDDYVMGITLVCRTVVAVETGLTVMMVFYSVYCASVTKIDTLVCGQDYLTLEALELSTDLLIVAECFYILAMLTLKISLGISFLRIFAVRWHRMVTYAAVILSTGFSTVLFFFTAFQCGATVNALSFFYRRLEGKCISSAEILGWSYTHAAIVMSTDLTFVVLPVALFRRLAMGRREKTAVIFILILGGVGGIASAIRFRYIKALTESTTAFFANAHYIALWSTIEPGLGITAGSLATLRKLFEWVRRLPSTIWSSSAASRSPHGTQAGSSRKSKDGSKITKTYSNHSFLVFTGRGPSQSSRQPNKVMDIEMEALTEEPEYYPPSFHQSEHQSEPIE